MSAATDEFNELMRDKERRSTHPEDDADGPHGSFSGDEDSSDRMTHGYDDDEDYDDHPPYSRPSTTTTTTRHIIPNTRYQANTGPKGVISDAQDFRDSQRIHVRRSQQLSREKYQRNGSPSWHDPPSSMTEKSTVYDIDEDLEDLEDDEDFMRSWRDGRLAQLASAGHAPSMQERAAQLGRKAWGVLKTVDGEGYLDAVEKSPKGTVVVVYIYDDESDVSVELGDCLRTLARQRLETRFVQLHYEDAEMEPAGVPALLAYCDGEKFAGLVPLVDEIPDDADVSAGTLEMLLKRHQILR